MLIRYTPNEIDADDTSTRGYDKVAAIKAVRAFNGMLLVDAKELIELIVRDGEVTTFDCVGNTKEFAASLAAAGNFTLHETEFELYSTLTKCVNVAVGINDFDTAKAIINILQANRTK